MGNQGLSRSDYKAILGDGQQNVKQLALLLQNRNHLGQYVGDLKKQISTDINKLTQEKKSLINGKISQIKNIYQNKTKQIEAAAPGTLQKLSANSKLSLGQLTGLDGAVKKLQELERKSSQMMNQQKDKLFSSVETYTESFQGTIQKQKSQLTNLTNLNKESQQKILSHFIKQNKEEVAASNKSVQQTLLKTLNLEQMYKKGAQAVGSKVQLDGILQGFKETLNNSTAKKGLLGCF